MLNDYEIRRYDKLLATLKLIISAIALYIVVQIVPSFIDLLEENRPSYTDDLMVRVIANSNTEKDQQIKQQVALDLDQFINNSSTVEFNTEASLKANCNVGSYLSFSMALMVCLETLQSFAISS